MKLLRKENIKRFVALALAVVLCVIPLVSCAEAVKDPVMEYGGEKISLEMYEFLLSRMKGTLARQGIDVSATSAFWDETHKGSGLTNEQYYNKAVLESCKNYLAALAMFKEEGMKLSDAKLEAIEEEISFYIEYDGKGEEEKLDLILSKYGTSTAGLRKIYEIEAKYNAIVSSIYGTNASQIAGNVKDEHYKANYYRFKQIVIANYYYEYIVDADGNTMYFDSESGKPVYDSKGEYHYDSEGNRILDEYKVAIRYDEDGNILYDKEKGRPAPTKDENGRAIEHKYTEEQMIERASKIEAIVNAAANKNFAAFESEMPNWYVYVGAGEYCPDGYYLSDIESGIYDEVMDSILATLKGMQIGEVKVVESVSGYHIIMRYELDAGKYDNSEYAEWFGEFDSSLTSKLFLEKCGKYVDKVELDAENIAKAKSIRNVGSNYDY